MGDLAELRRVVDRMKAEGADDGSWGEATRLLAGFKVDTWKADRAVRDRDVGILDEMVREIESLTARESRTRGY